MQKLIILLFTCSFCFAQQNTEIKTTLEQWHKAAADADFDTYFGLMTSDAIFIGTDPTENWNITAFKAFSKPYFDKGKAWSFSTLDRNIFLKDNNNIAWFDELLDTQMGICRGSGIVEKTVSGWKIKHYVLSITIPNDNVKEVTALKKKFDTDLMNELRADKN
ncbi:nuclear transport factor 2 family protein [Aquimarina sp. I32.4]|uniref:nuclear transport factor 2 family protein n=1 Tax=Aquimarina sp. I32.4 TaxID=2053903 RepID=UPI000CDF0C13|nr:nuclear transport factor 2 family protein [Aquimarina sp. I32.4]